MRIRSLRVTKLHDAAGTIDLAEYAVIAEAYQVKHAQLGALRSWMDQIWHPPGIDIHDSEVHHLIVDLEFPIIYDELRPLD